MNNQRPLSKRKQVQLLVILTIFAWATQTLLHQWGYGQVLDNTTGSASEVSASADFADGQKFVPSDSPNAPAGTLEVRNEASILGSDVKLKQVCRWSEADAGVFTPIANLVLVHVGNGTPFKAITVDDIRRTLHDAGVNIAMINFSGATSCNISRSDVALDPQQAMQQWIDAHQSDNAAHAPAQPRETPTAVSSGELVEQPAAFESKPDPNFHTLKNLLLEDLSRRLQVDRELLQVDFSNQDEKTLALAEPCFKFDIGSNRVRNLGNVVWEVTISTETANKKISISAVARAWQNQVVVTTPLAVRELLSAKDFTTRRVLVDSLPDQPLLTLEQCVGEQAAQDLKPGAVMTARLVDPVPLVRSGQLVTITLTQGSVQIRSVARAMETGGLGQTVKVRDEQSPPNLFYVTVTGVQEGRLSGQTSFAAVSQRN